MYANVQRICMYGLRFHHFSLLLPTAQTKQNHPSYYGNAIEVLTTDLTNSAAGLGTTLADLSNLMEQYFDGVADLLQRYKHLKQYIDQGTYKERSFDQDSNSTDSLDYNPDSS